MFLNNIVLHHVSNFHNFQNAETFRHNINMLHYYLIKICYCFGPPGLTRVPPVSEVRSSNTKGRLNRTQRCKRFTTASTYTQIAEFP